MEILIFEARQPYYVLTLADDGEIFSDAVLAWIVAANGSRRPVTAGADDGPEWTLERPDGQVEESSRRFADREAWRQVLLAERAAATSQAAPEGTS
jgi:hypothetical protein